jgi:hypothetical protein
MTPPPVVSRKQLVPSRFFQMSPSEGDTIDSAMRAFKMVVVAANTNSMISLTSLKPLEIFSVAVGCLVAVGGPQDLKKAVMSFVKFLLLCSKLHVVKVKRSTFVAMKNA